MFLSCPYTTDNTVATAWDILFNIILHIHQGITLKKFPKIYIPHSKVHRPNMGSIWGRQDPDGPHVGHMNSAIWDINYESKSNRLSQHDVISIDLESKSERSP